jgi:hypothetical protein
MKKTFTHICLVVSFLGMSMAFTNSAVAQTLATGSFNCRVFVFDGGEPEASAYMDFDQVLGIIGGPVSGNIAIGTGSGLEAICEELAETISGLAKNQTCTVSAIQNIQYVGGNFTENEWSFDILCNGKETNVINAISILLEEMLTTPLVVQQTIQKKSNEMR